MSAWCPHLVASGVFDVRKFQQPEQGVCQRSILCCLPCCIICLSWGCAVEFLPVLIAEAGNALFEVVCQLLAPCCLWLVQLTDLNLGCQGSVRYQLNCLSVEDRMEYWLSGGELFRGFEEVIGLSIMLQAVHWVLGVVVCLHQLYISLRTKAQLDL